MKRKQSCLGLPLYKNEILKCPAFWGPFAMEARDGNPTSRVLNEMSVENEEVVGESGEGR